MFLIAKWQGAQWFSGFGSNKSTAVQKADRLPVELRACYLLSTASMEMAQTSNGCIQWVTLTFIRTIFPNQLPGSQSALTLHLNRLAMFNKVNLTIPFFLSPALLVHAVC